MNLFRNLLSDKNGPLRLIDICSPSAPLRVWKLWVVLAYTVHHPFNAILPISTSLGLATIHLVTGVVFEWILGGTKLMRRSTRPLRSLPLIRPFSNRSPTRQHLWFWGGLFPYKLLMFLQMRRPSNLPDTHPADLHHPFLIITCRDILRWPENPLSGGPLVQGQMISVSLPRAEGPSAARTRIPSLMDPIDHLLPTQVVRYHPKPTPQKTFITRRLDPIMVPK